MFYQVASWLGVTFISGNNHKGPSLQIEIFVMSTLHYVFKKLNLDVVAKPHRTRFSTVVKSS